MKPMLLVIGLVLGIWIGWIQAHNTIAKECRKLGWFYVGSSIFKCVEIAKDKNNSEVSNGPDQ